MNAEQRARWYEEKPRPGTGPYVDCCIATVNAIEPGLWDNLHLVPELDAEKARKVLRFLLELACIAQNDANHRIGGWGIASMPRAWVLANIENEVEPILQQATDDWEWRRLMELAEDLDRNMATRIAQRAAAHADPAVAEAGRDFLETSE